MQIFSTAMTRLSPKGKILVRTEIDKEPELAAQALATLNLDSAVEMTYLL